MSCLVVSACLLGRACRYDGASKAHPVVRQVVADHESSGGQAVSVCPEELGDLGTPRPAAELSGGDGAAVWAGEAQVRRCHDSADVTQSFVTGAQRAYALTPGATWAILKARSPSCGCGSTHIDGEVSAGDGVFAALLRQHGVELFTEETLPPASVSGAETPGA